MGPRPGVSWALSGSSDSIPRAVGADGVTVLVGTRAMVAKTNKSLLSSLEKMGTACMTVRSGSVAWWLCSCPLGFPLVLRVVKAAVGIMCLLQGIFCLSLLSYRS